MKKISYLLFAIGFVTSSYAQNAKIKGTLINSTNKKPIPYVTIELNKKTKTYSNDNGSFQFLKLEPGTYKLSFTALGLEDKIIDSISIKTVDDIIDLSKISIEEKNIQIAEITVIGSTGIYNEKYASSNSVVSKAELERTQAIGSEEVLKKVVGVNVSGDMGISNRLNIGIRGSYPRRSEHLLVLEDGTPIAPAQYLAPEAYYNPPSDRLDGIEIIKGADVLSLGSNTMYGVVNYITKRPPSTPTLDLTLTGGENGYNAQYLSYGGTWNKTGAEIQVLNKHFDGFIQNSQSDIFNTTAKIFSDLTEKSSIYAKVNYHQETSKASYSAITPYTYNINPKLNPFDADDLFSKRYAIDLAHKYKANKNVTLTTKVYANQFQRDWWRQENTLIKANAAEKYLGSEIYNSERYSYLANNTNEDEDWIRVGVVAGGKEKTRARNRTFKVAGVQETLNYNWEKNSLKGNFEAGIKYHAEQFNDVEFINDSSRFAKSGKLDKDNKFLLGAVSGYVKNKFTYGKINFTPTVRYEWLEMRRFDLKKIAENKYNTGSKNFGSNLNTFTTLLAGASFNYELLNNEKNNLQLFTGAYQGYTPPTSGYGFLSVTDGVVTNPTPTDEINIEAETSINFEAGFRGNLLGQKIETQTTYFNNNINNFYSAGRNEAFQTLGSVTIQGVEANAIVNLHKIVSMPNQNLSIGVAYTAMQSVITSGKLNDADILRAKHTDESKAELVTKINTERNGFEIYFADTKGKDSLITRELTDTDFSKIKKMTYVFGKDGIKNNAAPYIPTSIINISVSYGFGNLLVSANYNKVAAQYTDYVNLTNETLEGAMGKLPSFNTIDANVSYSFKNAKNKYLSGLTLFVAGKNLTNEVYKASRLHRVSSGIMPGGFRQVNAGLKLKI